MSRRKPIPSAWGDTIHTRIAWLADDRFGGSRSALARAVGFSHTLLVQVANDRKPGRRLLDAIAARLHVRRLWLEDGEGEPFLPNAPVEEGIPTTHVLLPGPPAEYEHLLIGRVETPHIAASPGLYWLVLTSTHPLVRQRGSGFRVSDHLLMQSDPTRFPPEADFHDDLCVVRVNSGTTLTLARVRYISPSLDSGPARLEAEVVVPDASEVVEREIVDHKYRHFPDGVVTYTQTRVPAGRNHVRMEPELPIVQYADVVGVWQRITHRPLD